MRCRSAVGEGITGHAFRTRANWDVVDNVTAGVETTSSRAGIATFVTETAAIARAFIVDDTLWTARFVRVTDVFRQALAIAMTSANRI